jgi:hypothetical protein
VDFRGIPLATSSVSVGPDGKRRDAYRTIVDIGHGWGERDQKSELCVAPFDSTLK